MALKTQKFGIFVTGKIEKLKNLILTIESA